MSTIRDATRGAIGREIEPTQLLHCITSDKAAQLIVLFLHPAFDIDHSHILPENDFSYKDIY